MVKVLVADKNTQKTNEYCHYLSNNLDSRTIIANSGTETITKYQKFEPNILVLDSQFDDINSLEIIDRLSTTVDEKRNINIILTTKSDKEQATFCDVSKVYKFIRKPFELEELSSTIIKMEQENHYPKLDEDYLNKLLFSMNIIPYGNRAKILIDAIKECYYIPYYCSHTYELYNELLKKYPYNNCEAIRSAIRDCIKPLNYHRDRLKDHPVVRKFEPGADISNSEFLKVLISYLHFEKNKEIIF